MREEGGTPAIIESIRAGLVFQLKEAVGADAIREREVDFIQRAIASWSTNPNIAILGNKSAWRLSIVSFIVRHRNAYLHHNFVVALLNDLFGIQSRGGCGCAGPYGHRLLGIDIETSKEFEREIVRGCEGIKPGWVRVNFNYFLSETQFQFILDAIHLIANDGWRLLPHYRFDPDTGEWRHRAHSAKRRDAARRASPIAPARWSIARATSTEPEWALPSYLEEAKRIIAATTDEFAHARDRGAARARPTSRSCAGSRCRARCSRSYAAGRPGGTRGCCDRSHFDESARRTSGRGRSSCTRSRCRRCRCASCE